MGTPRFVSIKPFVSTATCCAGFQLNVGEVARAYLFDMSDVLVSAWAVAPTQSEADILIPKVEMLLGTIDFEDR